MALDPELKSVLETLEEVSKKLTDLNNEPNTAPVVMQGVEDGPTDPAPTNRALNKSDMFELRQKLATKSTSELMTMFSMQARKSDSGIPFETWAGAGGQPLSAAIGRDQELTKLLDTGGASALIRQDLEPLLYALFVKTFPAWERFSKEPANGLVHAYNQITAYGDAQFMTELGTVTDDVTTYVRKTANVAVIATRRGISLKSQFAVTAGGMGYNPEQIELQSGLRAIAHKMQKTIFQGNAEATASGGTASDELGLYDANSFTGLRQLLNLSKVKNVDPTATTPEDMRAQFDWAAREIMDLGGSCNIIWTTPTNKVQFDLQQDANVRYMNNFVNVTPGVLTNAVNTVFGPLPIAVVPGDSIGTYVTSNTDGSFNGGETVADAYLLDESTITLPYLGSDGPTVLDIPIGISGQLTHLYIMFGMWGMAVKALPFSNKVRIKQPA
jgi:hypothetical protein